MDDIKKLNKKELIKQYNLLKEENDALKKRYNNENKYHEEIIKEYKGELNKLKKENTELKEKRINGNYDEETLKQIEYLEKRYKDTGNKMYLEQRDKICN